MMMFLSFMVVLPTANAVKPESNDNFQMSLGYKSYKIKDLDDALNGLEITFGKQYQLGKNFIGKTSIDFSYASVKYDYLFSDVVVMSHTFKEYAYGVKQTIYFDGDIGTLLFRPFVDFGIGHSNAVSEYNTIFGSNNTDRRKLFYLKYDIGAQFLSQKGIGGELKVGQQRNNDYVANSAAVAFIYTF